PLSSRIRKFERRGRYFERQLERRRRKRLWHEQRQRNRRLARWRSRYGNRLEHDGRHRRRVLVRHGRRQVKEQRAAQRGPFRFQRNVVGGGLSSNPRRGVTASAFFHSFLVACPHKCPRLAL